MKRPCYTGSVNYLFRQVLSGGINIEIPKSVNSSQNKTHIYYSTQSRQEIDNSSLQKSIISLCCILISKSTFLIITRFLGQNTNLVSNIRILCCIQRNTENTTFGSFYITRNWIPEHR